MTYMNNRGFEEENWCLKALILKEMEERVPSSGPRSSNPTFAYKHLFKKSFTLSASVFSSERDWISKVLGSLQS